MIICQNCRNKEMEGALFCSECGAQLVVGDHSVTRTISETSTEIPAISSTPMDEQGVHTKLDASLPVISLLVVGFEKVIPLSGKSEFTLGRISEGQPVLPDVDLTQYDAYSQGVSRLHVSIKLDPLKVMVVDLGSANGTRVNGQKIMPHIDYPLSHGDILALGKLKIQIYIQ